jgi:hypothetical protein
MAMRDDHSIVEQVNVGQRNEWIPFLICRGEEVGN